MFRLLIFAITAVMLSACSSTTTIDERIAAIDDAITDHDYIQAQKSCDALLLDLGYDGLSPEQLCHLALNYIKLSEQTNEEENAANAVHCYQIANSVDSVAVLRYLTTLPSEDFQYVFLIKELTARLEYIPPYNIEYDSFDVFYEP